MDMSRVLTFTRYGGNFTKMMWFVFRAGEMDHGDMNEDPDNPNELEDEAPATPDETRAALLERSGRGFAPIHKSFVQNPDRTQTNRQAPLAVFVRNGDLRGLRAFLFLHAIISNGDQGWSTTLPLSVWARAFGTTQDAEPTSATTAASKVIRRLVDRSLVTRSHGKGRDVTLTLLRPDGSGAAYERPLGKGIDRYLKLDHAYWSQGWYQQLDLPATAMLLVALHEKPTFILPTEHMKSWYGFSPDTAERGFATLMGCGLLTCRQKLRKAPLSPTGVVPVNVYTLQPPFGPPAPSPGALADLFGSDEKSSR